MRRTRFANRVRWTITRTTRLRLALGSSCSTRSNTHSVVRTTNVAALEDARLIDERRSRCGTAMRAAARAAAAAAARESIASGSGSGEHESGVQQRG